jgi:hypothetical protein
MMQTGNTQVLVTSSGATSVEQAQQIYRALQSQRDILYDQLRTAQRTREQMVQQLRNDPGMNEAARTGIEKRITSVDARITELDKQIAASEQAVANAAAVPGATVRPPPPPRSGPPEEAFALAGFLGLIVLLPLTIAFSRRIWRRSARAEVTLPPEMRDRMEALERGVEAIALEVERIGEGQRFVTQALVERVPAGRAA